MIPFLDLAKINARDRDELIGAFTRVLDGGWYVLGKEVEAFEREYSAYCGTRHCVGVGNGLEALVLILRAWLELGVFRQGDEVIVPANTYIATILAITGKRTDTRSGGAGSGYLQSRSNADSTAYRPAYPRNIAGASLRPDRRHVRDQFNWRANMGLKSSRIARKRTARAMRVCWRVRWVTLQDTASSPPRISVRWAMPEPSPLTMVRSRMRCARCAITDRIASTKNIYKGVNSRLDELQAALLRVKLKRVDADNRRRQAIALRYLREIRHPHIKLPIVGTNNEAVWHVFVVRAAARDALQAHLNSQGIGTLIHYPIPPHQQRAYREWNERSYPITEQIHREVLSLPISQ
jgi:hypothetical protein